MVSEYQTKIVEGKSQVTGMQLRFTFIESKKGVWFYPIAKENVRGLYVKIKIEFPNKDNKFADIRVIQIGRVYDYWINGNKKEKIAPQYAAAADELMPNLYFNRAGYSDVKKNKDKSLGWFVDSEKDTVFYDQKHAFVAPKGNTAGFLYDAPGRLLKEKKMGGEFESHVIGYDKQGNGEYIGGVRWGYYINSNQKVVTDPVNPEFIDKATPQLGHAIHRYNLLAVVKIKGVKIK